MTNKIVAIQGDHLKNLNVKTDSTIFLANEAQKRGFKLFYYYPENLSNIRGKTISKGYFIKISYSKKKFYKILKKTKLDLSLTNYILIRQDPPFNLEYISTTLLLDRIKYKTKIINDPTAVRNISEKFYSLNFEKYMANTIFTKDLLEIKNFFKKHKKIIIKPIHSFGGNDIYLIAEKFSERKIKKILKKHGHIMCQKFLSKIRFGDKRVFIINGKVCGAISRVPKLGSILSNMSKGAIPRLANLTKNELKISNIISKKIKRDGIYFAGIDFIDGKLNGDINVTSPTGIKTYFDLSNVNLAETFWKGL
ncbi:glutathione synthase [Candidatus Pelagibacter sp.]|nr:glutathione synthase [Candidatus Pelagibacter sp.]